MPLPTSTSHPLLIAVARELARKLGGRVQDHITDARRLLAEVLTGAGRGVHAGG